MTIEKIKKELTGEHIFNRSQINLILKKDTSKMTTQELDTLYLRAWFHKRYVQTGNRKCAAMTKKNRYRDVYTESRTKKELLVKMYRDLYCPAPSKKKQVPESYYTNLRKKYGIK